MGSFAYHSNTYYIEYGITVGDSDNRELTDKPLVVNCAGRVSTPETHINENQRLDYYLIFLVSGKIELYNDDNVIPLSIGDMVVFPPKEKYKFKCYGEEKKSFLWIHFTGYNALDKLNEYGIALFPQINKTNLKNHIHSRFQKLFEAFTKNDRFRNNDLSALLDKLLIEMGRAIENTALQKISLLKSIRYINEFYTEQIKITELAKIENMCMTTYNLHFKKQLGVSPTKYIIMLRMSLAKELLETSDLSVTEISTMCGYSEINFFSKVFKNECGFAPTEYRKLKHDKTI